MAGVGKLELVAWWQCCGSMHELSEGISGSRGREATGWVAGVPNPITIDRVGEAGALPASLDAGKQDVVPFLAYIQAQPWRLGASQISRMMNPLLQLILASGF